MVLVRKTKLLLRSEVTTFLGKSFIDLKVTKIYHIYPKQ